MLTLVFTFTIIPHISYNVISVFTFSSNSFCDPRKNRHSRNTRYNTYSVLHVLYSGNQSAKGY